MRFAPSRGENSNRLDRIPDEVKRNLVIEICHGFGREHGVPRKDHCVMKNHACYRCQDLADLALRRAEQTEASDE